MFYDCTHNQLCLLDADETMRDSITDFILIINIIITAIVSIISQQADTHIFFQWIT